MNVEWRKRHDFAEVAEALGVRTDQVMGMMPGEIVLYTPDGDDETVWSAVLGRREDGVLFASCREPHPGLWETLRMTLEEDR